jgi:YidC/Oxa1 family membrane protein insertase
MTYWLVSNFWTMGQQFVVIRNMPTPGSDAALARDARMAKKRERKGIVLIEDEGDEEVPEEPKQRQQPVSKDRAKKKKKKRK